MAYKTLYRKYRPTTFDEVVGQKYIIETIKNSIINERICHAYLFSGPRGIGKTSIARIIAKAVNCKHLENGNPCNECETCSAINDQSAIDVVEIDAASNNGVDEIRLLLEKVNFLPAAAKYKIYIIDEVHMLSISAFNALLKTLEEPPMHVIFILATTEVHKIPATILSRCQRFDFKALTNEEIKSQLIKIKEAENIQITDDALDIICDASEGGMRDALSILDQAASFKSDLITQEDVENITGRVSSSDLLELIKLIHQEKVSEALDQSTYILNKGKEANILVQMMLATYRDMLLYNIGSKTIQKYIYNNETFIDLAKQIKKSKIFKYVDILNDLQNKLKFTTAGKIYLEVSLVKMMSKEQNELSYVQNDVDLTDIYNRLSLLEIEPKNNDTDNIKEFKDFTKGKLEFLENIVSKLATQPQDLVERLEALEEQTPTEELERRLNKLESQNQAPLSEESIQNNQVDLTEINNRLLSLEEKATQPIDLSKVEERLNALENKENKEEPLNLNDLEYQLEEIKAQLASCVTYEYLNSQNVKQDESDNNLFNQGYANNNLEDIYKRLNELERDINTPIDEPLPFDDEPLGENNQEELIASIAMNQENIANLKDQVIGLNTMVEELRALNSQDVTNKLDLFQDSILQIQEELNSVKAELTKLQDKPSPIDEKMFTDLKDALSELKEYAFKLGGRVSALEERPQQEAKEPAILTKRPQPFETRPREEQQILDQTIKVKEEVVQNEPKELPDGQRDDTQKVYDIKVIENILHQSRDKRNLDDSNKINSVWSRLASLVPEQLQTIATTLSEGKVVVSGANYLLIIYQKASICNYLMTTKNHLDARQVLRNTLQKDYDFIALPNNTWQEKRTEYKNQYHMGIKYPTLTPINNPELRVINLTTPTFKTQKSQNYDKAVELFGESIIKEVK